MKVHLNTVKTHCGWSGYYKIINYEQIISNVKKYIYIYHIHIYINTQISKERLVRLI